MNSIFPPWHGAGWAEALIWIVAMICATVLIAPLLFGHVITTTLKRLEADSTASFESVLKRSRDRHAAGNSPDKNGT